MSVNEAELAGNYATSGGSSDAGFVAKRLAEKQAQAAAQQREAADYETTRRHVETTTEPDLGTIDVAGETVPIERPLTEELGVGHIARLETLDGELGEGGAKSFVALLEALAAVSGEEYDEDFWFDLTDEEIGAAFRQAALQSRGGNGR